MASAHSSVSSIFFHPGMKLMRRLPPSAKMALVGLCGLLGPLVPVCLWWRQPAGVTVEQLASVALITGALALYLFTAYVRTLMGAMRVLQASVAQLAAGDLAARIRLRATDELAVVGETMDQATGYISQMVSDIRSTSTMVAQSGIRLAEDTQAMAAQVDDQARKLETTAQRVRDVNAAVSSSARSAQAVDEQVAQVRQIAEAGGASVNSAVTSVQDIQSSSRRMQDIIAVIEGIAFQTNILALNAAVEAARAGEQGRGFAVVAAEVRSLAQRSANSAKEIKQLIGESVAHVDQGVQQIHGTREAFERILQGIRTVADEVRNIASNTQDQSQALGEVAGAMAQLDQITRDSTSVVQQAADSSGQLSERARRLSQAVASFRLRQGSADEALALVQQGLQLFRSQGMSALQSITEQGERYADRDMYIFVFDRQGQYKAFAGKPEKVGTNVRAVSGVDGDKLVRDAFERASHGGGWVDYEFANPQSGQTDLKTSYVEAITDELVMGCGVYKQQSKPGQVLETLSGALMRREQRAVLQQVQVPASAAPPRPRAQWQGA
jgi:methyl-accepting chemotaxis protein